LHENCVRFFRTLSCRSNCMPIWALSPRNGSIPTETVRCATHAIVAWQSSSLFSKRLVNPYE
jgi:hypothetical protein